MAYNPNQAGLFNRLIQSGLNTANAALQAGITSTKDFALGDNGNLGGLIPGANAIPATAQSVFQSVRFAETASGQPIQLAALATNAAPLDALQTIEIPPAPVTGLDLTVPGDALQTIVIPPRPVTGLDLTVPGQLVQAPGELGRGTFAPEVVTAAQLGTQAFPSTVNPALAEPAPVQNIQAPGELGRGTAAPEVVTAEQLGSQAFPTTVNPALAEPAPVLNIQAPGELGRGTFAPEVVTAEQLGSQAFPSTVNPALAEPAPQPTIYNVQTPGELGRSTSAPRPADANTAGLPIFNEEGQVVQGIRKNPEDGTTYYTEPPSDSVNQSQAESNRLANQQAAAEANTIQQAALEKTYKQPGNGDWRFRISLAKDATYLYKSEAGIGGNNILAPLVDTGGVIFPYTPSVTSSYQARYNTYELVHSNYRGAFYQSSFVSDINIRGVFTAQDTKEAAYMLAVIHFFRSVTKMFYGQDAQRGAPPPLVFLTGLGDYQYNRHPAVVTQFDYTLPNDVDYIRANYPNDFGTDLLNRRTPTAASPDKSISGAATRLLNSLLTPGAESNKPERAPITNSVTNTARATYVPTKIEISLTLMPMQTRDQVSKLFSLKEFSNGNLLRGGFW